jgi:RNA polymerase primary sigma factor
VVQGSATVAFLKSRVRSVPRPELPVEQSNVAQARRGDREALAHLLAASLSGVIAIAKEHRGRGVPLDDLISEGCVGLLKAVRRYRAENGTRFMTYAAFWIRKEILAAIAEQPHAVHVPDYAIRHGFRPPKLVRLDAPAFADNTVRLVDRLPHDGPLPVDAVVRSFESSRLRQELLRLTARERAVIIWRFGLCGSAPRTLDEIASDLSLSGERIRQIELAALRRLRRALELRSDRSSGGSAPRP